MIITQKSEEVRKYIARGCIIAHPADTCYGLAGIFGNESVLKKLQKLKGRDGKKPMSIMLSNKLWAADGEKYAKLNDFSRGVCQTFMPGPVTLLLPKGSKIPEWYFPETNLIGIRVPDDKNCQTLLEALNQPIITTSANPSGEPLCQNVEEIQKAFADQSDLLNLILRSSTPPPQRPSTILLVKENKIEIIREGPLSKDEIKARMKKSNLI